MITKKKNNLKTKNFLQHKNKQEKILNKLISTDNNIDTTEYKITSLRFLNIENNFDIILEENVNIIISGRIINLRKIGKITFGKIRDGIDDFQIIFEISKTKKYNEIIQNINLGDIIMCEVSLGKSKTNEPSLFVKEILYCKKNFLNLNKEQSFPKKTTGFVEPTIIYNLKYQKNFYLKSKLLYFVRNFLFQRGFIEVNTKIINNYYSGFESKPFITKHLGKKKFLRTSPELSLKRLIVSGFDKIFEIGTNFRNEHEDRTHYYEFMMLELYASYTNVNMLLDLMIIMLKEMVIFLYKNKTIFKFNKEYVDFDKDFKHVNVFEYLKTNFKFDFLNHSAEECFKFINTKFKKELEDYPNLKKQISISSLNNLELGYYIFSHFCDNLKGISIVSGIPSCVSLLAKTNNKDPRFANRYEIYINGVEIINMYDELNNYKQQKKNFQKIKKYSKNFVESLKLGLPPVAGLGIGIDRLLMVLTESENLKLIINHYD